MPDRVAAAKEGRFPSAFSREYCFECPLGHALHNFSGWWMLPARKATDEEHQELGIDWILKEV